MSLNNMLFGRILNLLKKQKSEAIIALFLLEPNATDNIIIRPGETDKRAAKRLADICERNIRNIAQKIAPGLSDAELCTPSLARLWPLSAGIWTNASRAEVTSLLDFCRYVQLGEVEQAPHDAEYEPSEEAREIAALVHLENLESEKEDEWPIGVRREDVYGLMRSSGSAIGSMYAELLEEFWIQGRGLIYFSTSRTAEENERAKIAFDVFNREKGDSLEDLMWSPLAVALLISARRGNVHTGIAPFARIPQPILLSLSSLRSDSGMEIKVLPKSDSDTFPVDDGFRHWYLQPPRGATLLLPFEEGLRLNNSQLGVSVRSVLDGGRLWAYLTAWALWHVQGSRKDGLFDASLSRVADLCGIKSYSRAGRDAPNFGKRMYDFRRDLEYLSQVGVKEIGEFKVRVSEALINEIENGKGQRLYRHAPLAISAILGAGPCFTQLPLAVVRLSAREAHIAIGLASLWRDRVVSAVLLPNAPGYYRDTLRSFIQQLGVFNANESRKRGRLYWEKQANDITRIVEKGEFGKMRVEGEGPEAAVIIEPTEALAMAYQGLADARIRRRAIERTSPSVATSPKKRLPGSRKGRPPA